MADHADCTHCRSPAAWDRLLASGMGPGSGLLSVNAAMMVRAEPGSQARRRRRGGVGGSAGPPVVGFCRRR
jgi:hypothetical protein